MYSDLCRNECGFVTNILVLFSFYTPYYCNDVVLTRLHENNFFASLT